MPAKTYPLVEQVILTITKPTDQLSTFENLLIREVLEQIDRNRRELS